MVDEGTIIESGLPMSFTPCHDAVSVQGGMWVLGIWGSLQCLNIPTIIWIYCLDKGKNLHYNEIPRMMLISLPIHKDGGNTCKVLGDRFQGYGMGVSLPELTQGYGDHGMGA